jgi:transketolase
MTYGEILTSIMTRRPEVVVLTAEARAVLGDIPDLFPDRFYDVGIAEQNLVGAAAGMSAAGMTPVVHSPLATFVTMRSFEQIRTTVALNGHDVKIPGLLPGFATGYQGPTHVSLEDIALMRGIPGVTVMSTASQEELREVMERAFATRGCVYFRVPANMPERISYEKTPPPVDQPRLVHGGKHGLVIAEGGMVGKSLEAIEQLRKQGLDLGLVNLTMLDPVPAAALAEVIKPHAKIATVEEHFVTGGLGSIVAEVIAEAGLGSRLLRIGVNDVFTDRYTEHEPNLRYLGLDSAGIAARLQESFQ